MSATASLGPQSLPRRHDRQHERRVHVIRTLLSLTAIGALGVAAYGALIEPYRLRVRRVRVPVSSIRAPNVAIRILHITDLHFRAGDTRRVRMLQQLSELKPDLLLLTGDLIHGGRDPDAELQTVLEALAPIRANYGAYAVLGNHDHVRRHRIRSWFGAPVALSRYEQTGADARVPPKFAF